MTSSLPDIRLEPGKKVFFASDFHLGTPDAASSLEREKRIIRWLNGIEQEAQVIFLVGDLFDFWFEYKYVIPKGFIRFQGKLADLKDKGISVIFFTGNHDMWMFDYFTKELSIPIFRKPLPLQINGKQFLIGHGDGLGPGDRFYKFLKRVFSNPFFQWIFKMAPPRWGMGIAQRWSRKSRLMGLKKEKFLGEQEWLLQYCRQQEQIKHHDYYVFGHRHLPLDLEINTQSRYINLGEWVNYNTFAVFDGEQMKLQEFKG